MANFWDKYEHNSYDRWQWRKAAGNDVTEIVSLAKIFFENEIDKIFTPDTIIMARQVTLACVRQFYDPAQELLLVARDRETGALLAYTWADRGHYACWAFEEMAEVRMAHCALTLSARERIKLIAQMMYYWEEWATVYKIPVLCSTSVRENQQAFFKLHEQAGYSVRGSFAYKRIT